MVAQVYDMMVASGLCVTLAPHCKMAFLAGGHYLRRLPPRLATWAEDILSIDIFQGHESVFQDIFVYDLFGIRLESIEGPD